MNPAAPSDDRARLDARRQGLRRARHRGRRAHRRRPSRRSAPAFVDEVGAAGATVVVGHDMRDSSPGFAAAFARGATARGADVVVIGLCSTDESYFASGSMHAPAAMFTASHNPAAYNGIKFSRAGAQGISLDTGPRRDPRPRRRLPRATASPRSPRRRARSRRADVLADYAGLPPLARRPSRHPPAEDRRRRRQRHGRAHRPGRARRGSRPAGAAARDRAALLRARRHLPEPRGEPARAGEPRRPAARRGRARRRPRPRLRRRRRPLLRRRRARAARSTRRAVAAIVALREIARVRARRRESDVIVIHNLITSRFVPETIEAAGATPVRTRVGHSLIKDRMRETRCGLRRRALAPTTTSATSGAPTTACSRRCTCSPSSARRTAPLSELAARFTPYALSRRDQLDRRRRARRLHAHRRGVHRARRVRRARRAHGRRHHRRERAVLVVQRAALEHRAAAAPQRRGRRRRHDGARSATRCSPSSAPG